jgi:glycosyltransferase involved in cell wall biosynthesis
MPQVSILMSVYNGMPYLPEAVNSILNQTFQDFTLLIINDGSTDGSAAYLNGLTDPRVKVTHLARNVGQGAARNIGLAMCNTEFTAIADADDVALPDRIATQLNFLSQHREVGTVGSQCAYLGPSGRTGFSPPLPCGHESIYADLLRGRVALCHSALICRAALLKRIGGYRIEGSGEDWDLFLRMGEASKLANLPETLQLVRLHSNSSSMRCLTEIRVQIAFACHCAQRRQQGLPELSIDEFRSELRARPFWQRAADRMNCYALAEYRRALLEILSASEFKGYARLGWSVLCSPQRTWQRLCREARKIRQTTRGARRVRSATPRTPPSATTRCS